MVVRLRKRKLSSTKSAVLSDIALHQKEINYLKGLSILLIVFMLCVFFAFGSLFCAMYMETKIMRVNLEKYLNGSMTPVAVSAEATAVPEIQWLSFAKYGVNVSFPNSWTYLDKPFQKQINFYSDGRVRSDDNKNTGDLVVSIVARDNYQAEYIRTPRPVAGKISFGYQVNDSQVVLVPLAKGFAELQFKAAVPLEIRDGILQRFELTK